MMSAENYIQSAKRWGGVFLDNFLQFSIKKHVVGPN